ncbi:MAG: hypothetical protein R2695_07465 [Acidimicrobiales bacterium]
MGPASRHGREPGALTEAGLTGFVESEGLGIGLGTFLNDSDNIIHNTVIWLLVEMSFVGVLFFLAMSAIPLQAALSLRRTDAALAFTLIGGHVVMVVTSNGIEALYQRQWWLIVGLCAVIPSRSADRLA